MLSGPGLPIASWIEIQVNRARGAESPIDEARLKAELDGIAAAHGAASPKARRAVLDLFKELLSTGRSLIRYRLEEDGAGRLAAERLSALADTLVRALFDFASGRVFRASNPS